MFKVDSGLVLVGEISCTWKSGWISVKTYVTGFSLEWKTLFYVESYWKRLYPCCRCQNSRRFSWSHAEIVYISQFVSGSINVCLEWHTTIFEREKVCNLQYYVSRTHGIFTWPTVFAKHSIYLPDRTARNTVSHNAMLFPLTNELETSAAIFLIAIMLHYLIEPTGFDSQMFKMWSIMF